jgi:hypothetical protein
MKTFPTTKKYLPTEIITVYEPRNMTEVTFHAICGEKPQQFSTCWKIERRKSSKFPFKA